MSILEILQIIASVATILVGVYSLILPQSIKGFTGLDVTGPRGVTEIRAVLGGAFIGLGAAALYLGVPAAYQILGITYLVIAAMRLVTMFIDRSVVQSNVISLLSEIVLGVILVL